MGKFIGKGPIYFQNHRTGLPVLPKKVQTTLSQQWNIQERYRNPDHSLSAKAKEPKLHAPTCMQVVSDQWEKKTLHKLIRSLYWLIYMLEGGSGFYVGGL